MRKRVCFYYVKGIREFCYRQSRWEVMSESVECWHFAAADRKLGYDDGRLIEAGGIHTVDCEPKCCKAGLHGSIRIIDALRYARGPNISRVRISGDIDQQYDKLCGRRRDYLAIADATDELRSFARWCALSVIHLWDAPDVVRKYLETGDESIRAASQAAAAVAAWDASWTPSWAAARAASEAASWDAAKSAAEAAAWAAARDASEAAAWDAAKAAARAEAWDEARDAAWDADRAAAGAAQNAELDKRMRKLLNLEPAT